MVDAEPVLNARTSVSRMIGAVEQAIASRSNIPFQPGTIRPDISLAAIQATPTDRGIAQAPSYHENNFTSIANDFIHLGDGQSQAPAAYETQQHSAQSAVAVSSFDSSTAMVDPLSLLDFNVLTTDLYNFFPISTDMNIIE
jgi:hypothetical protein